MDTSILFSARAWAALVPLLVLFGRALGLELTEGMLTTTGEQASAFAVSLLGFWSLLQKNTISAKGLGQLLQRRTWMVVIPLLVIGSQAIGHPIDADALKAFGENPLVVSLVLAVISKLRGDSAGTLAARALVR